MSEVFIEYRGEKYKYRNGKWYDSSNLVVPVALSVRLNHILDGGKKKKEYDKKINHQIDVQIKRKNYDEAFRIAQKHNNLRKEEKINKAIEEDKKTIERNQRMLEQKLIFQEQIFDFDRTKYHIGGKVDSAYLASLKAAENYWKKKDYYMAYRSIDRNQLEIANKLGQIQTPRVKNSNGINYIYDYVPKRGTDSATDFERVIVDRIFSLKDCMRYPDKEATKAAIKNIAADLWLALTNNYPKVERFHLTCVQPATKGEMAPLSICIEFMCRYGLGLFINDSDLIKREKSVPKAHSTKDRPTYQMQLDSLRCTKSIKVSDKERVVILDDIVTTGTQLRANRDLLIANGIREQSIILMTYARTLNIGF